ncbi:MAG TPA: HEAT repeat domain-containing protein, partial [Roseimicrobium sp.]|nr:HEAT repeat domain-containing protein [Roseimicrobium sp.]
MPKLNLSSAALACAALSLSFASLTPAAEIGANKSDAVGLKKEDRRPEPVVAPASPEAENNLKRIKVPAGLRMDLWAAEPMLANPVAFTLDEKGRVFVSETYRYRTSVLDIRHYMFMLEDDLACRTVEDRVAMSKKWFGKQAEDLKIETEVVRLLEDTTGSGVANKSSVYADGFTDMLDGIASGVLARKDTVYFTDIPNLWRMDGTDKDGHAKKRESLSYGYGVRFSFTGHDMHGLAIGPDGKLYYSIGDRGATVKTKEGKVLSYPDEGSVFRCNLDGSDLEVIYHGLRNPQELTFDQYGNLFTGDNDFDHGDEERLVYIVEGGESGWRVGYQHAPMGYDRVPWKSEQIWMSHNARQGDYYGKEVKNRTADTGIRPAAYLPPISNIGDGPSGFTYNPGSVALPSQYDNRFFLCHFKGAIGTSMINTFAVNPKGAGFELSDSKPFVTQLQPTDCEFGPDGALYFSDWGEGWERTKKGRIYRVYDETLLNSPEVLATKKLIGDGMDKHSVKELVKLLEHRDKRVRQEAHFALAARKANSALAEVAAKNSNQLARIHAIWGLGIVGRNDAKALTPVIALLSDKDAEIRSQAARVLGDAKVAKAFDGLVKNLSDENTRVRFFAAMALAKLGNPAAVPAVVEMLRLNADKDSFLRHGGVMALKGSADAKAIAGLSTDKSASVRLAAVLALRKMASPEIARFLKDSEPAIVVEAARAINDEPIVTAMPQLAALATAESAVATSKWSDPYLVRVINANYRVGGEAEAQSLVKFISSKSAPSDMQ